MVTIKDIAAECKVSIATVSNIINGRHKASPETEKRVLEAIERLGYRRNNIASSLRSRKSHTIGIIIEDISLFTVPPIVESIMSFLEEYKYDTVVYNLRFYSRWPDTWQDQTKKLHPVISQAVSDMQARMVDGIIYVAMYQREADIFRDDPYIPVVMAYAEEKNPFVPSVVVDAEASAYEATSYLIKNGHRKIGVIGSEPEKQYTAARLNGVKKALREIGEELPERYMYCKGYEKSNGYDAAALLIKEDITAFFCMTDRLAGGVYQYLQEQKISVGRDISVIGYGGRELAAYLVPGLSTMALPLAEIGRTAASLLLQCMEAEIPRPDHQVIKLPCYLVSRDSVASLNN